jgi:uncharacterized protein with HEPN domain
VNRDRVWLKFMLERVARLERIHAAGGAAFIADALLQDAAARNLQVLADTSLRLSSGLLDAHPAVEWQSLHALRNLLVHEALSIEPRWLWDCLEQDLPALRQALEALLRGE